jgi:tetratricopeptide (TPR) repeat protein
LRSRFVSVRPLVALLITSLFLVSCASRVDRYVLPKVSRLELGNWRELRSPDFVLIARGSREHLEAFAIDLARFIAVVEHLVQRQPPKAPAHISIVDQQAEALFITSRNVAGYMSHTIGGFNGFIRGGGHDPVRRHVLLHEFTHYLNLRNTRLAYPIWYQEGFAEFLGSTRARGNTMEIGSVPPGRLNALAYRASRKKPIDLEPIFAFEKTARRGYPPEFYAISWATVHYLNSNQDDRERLVRMIELQAAGLHWMRAYSRSFTEPIETLSARVERHVEMLSKGTPGAVQYLPIETLGVRRDWIIRIIPPAEVPRLLGEFSLHEAVWGSTDYSQRLSQALFQRALELDPTDSRAHAGLAVVYSAQAEFERANAHLAAFGRDADPSIHEIVHAGNGVQQHALSLENKNDAEDSKRLHASAIQHYRQALEIDSSNAFALMGLGLSQLETGDFDQARSSLAEAQSLGEWDADLTLNRGRLEQKTGFNEQARGFWNEVVRLGSEADAKRAAEFLEDLESPE